MKFITLLFFLIHISSSYAEELFGYLELPVSAEIVNSTGEPTFSKETEIVREGEFSEKFMLGHGDCGKGEDGYSDCNMDRGRVERRTDYVNRHKAFYTFSIYVPKDFNPTRFTSIAQAKIKKVRPPVWMFGLAEDGMGGIFLNLEFNTIGRKCKRIYPISKMYDKWTDIDFFVSYKNKYDPQVEKSLAALWINKKRVKVPCFNKNVLKNVISKKEVGQFKSKAVNFKYGIYHSYVSRWLYIENIKAGYKADVKGWIDKTGKGKSGSSKSYTNEPWKIDWKLKMPLKTLYFDRIKISDKMPDYLK